MRVFSLILLAFLVFIAVLYTAIGLEFGIAKRRSRNLVFSFIFGLVIGLIGGFVVIYDLKISKDAVSFDIELVRWLMATFLAVLFGGLLILFMYKRK